jgi:hypothetical protein
VVPVERIYGTARAKTRVFRPTCDCFAGMETYVDIRRHTFSVDK